MRTQTNKLWNMIESGEIAALDVADMCLAFMSEAQVECMMQANDILDEEDEDDDSEYEHDGQPDEAQEWESFDPDC